MTKTEEEEEEDEHGHDEREEDDDDIYSFSGLESYHTGSNASDYKIS